MAREAQSIEIDGVRYTVNQMMPMQALDLLQDILKMAGPGLAPLFDNLGRLDALLDADVADVETKFLGEAVRALCAGWDKGVAERAIKTLAAHTVLEPGGPLHKVFDAHFAGNLGALMRWLPFALKVQYADFSSAFANVKGLVRSPAATTKA